VRLLSFPGCAPCLRSHPRRRGCARAAGRIPRPSGKMGRTARVGPARARARGFQGHRPRPRAWNRPPSPRASLGEACLWKRFHSSGAQERNPRRRSLSVKRAHSRASVCFPGVTCVKGRFLFTTGGASLDRSRSERARGERTLVVPRRCPASAAFAKPDSPKPTRAEHQWVRSSWFRDPRSR